MDDRSINFFKFIRGYRTGESGLAVVLTTLLWIAVTSAFLHAQGQSRLTLDQVEELIRVGAPDSAIAGEIEHRGLDSIPSKDTLEMLRRVGAGPATLQAIGGKLSHTASGTRLILQVQVIEAVSQETDQAIDRVLTLLRGRNIKWDEIRKISDTSFLINIASEQAGAVRDLLTNQFPDWEVSPAPGEPSGYIVTMRPSRIASIQSQTMDQEVETIRRRINALGQTEPHAALYGQGRDEIFVDLPGEVDLKRAKSLIQTPGDLELLRLASTTAYPSEVAAVAAYGGVLPSGTMLVAGRTGVYLLDRTPIITSRDLRSATALASTEKSGSYDVAFQLSTESARRYAAFTGSHVGDSLAVILDRRVEQVVIIREQMHDQGRISGGFSEQEARDLAILLRLGPLPASVKYLKQTVSP